MCELCELVYCFIPICFSPYPLSWTLRNPEFIQRRLDEVLGDLESASDKHLDKLLDRGESIYILSWTSNFHTVDYDPQSSYSECSNYKIRKDLNVKQPNFWNSFFTKLISSCNKRYTNHIIWNCAMSFDGTESTFFGLHHWSNSAGIGIA